MTTIKEKPLWIGLTALAVLSAAFAEENLAIDTTLTEGVRAPQFALVNQSGDTVRLDDFKGQPVVVYFYPKDFTSGCTREACDFRDNHAGFNELDAVVLGISPDDASSHAKFAAEHKLPFMLLADPELAAHKAYGAWGVKTNYGREYEGVIRSTFLIDGQGRVAKVWRNVKVDGHVEQVHKALVSLPKS